MTPHERLVATRAFYTGPDKWRRSSSKDGIRRCVLMAYLDVIGERYIEYGDPAYQAMKTVVSEMEGHSVGVGLFNDTHTFEEVMTMLERAIEITR